MKHFAALAMALTTAGTALAQDRTPVQRQTLSELAYAMGQSHALRQVCLGAADQYWRERMGRLLQTEAADEAFERSLRQAFNTGYAAAQAQFAACDSLSQAEAVQVARRGAALAEAAARP